MKKTLNMLFALLLVLLVSSAAQSQEPSCAPQEPPPHHPGYRGRTPCSAVDLWMERRAEMHPEEHRELKRLRRDDPEAFRRELKSRLRHRRGAHYANPLLKDFVAGLSPEQRNALVRMIEGMPECASECEPGRPSREDEGRRRIRMLADECRNAPDEETRRRLTEDLRVEISNLFDLRQEQRERQIQQIEKRLDHLKQSVEKRRSRRDEIIDRRMDELLEGEGQAPE